MNAFDSFQYFWLTIVAVMGLANLAWGINDIRVGSSRMQWWGSRVNRVDEPFDFWMAAGSKLFGFVVACFMFWFGLGMLNH